jgi:hypothetical protein
MKFAFLLFFSLQIIYLKNGCLFDEIPTNNIVPLNPDVVSRNYLYPICQNHLFTSVVENETNDKFLLLENESLEYIFSPYSSLSDIQIDGPIATNASQHTHPWLATCVSISFLLFVIYIIFTLGV